MFLLILFGGHFAFYLTFYFFKIIVDCYEKVDLCESITLNRYVCIELDES